ncbi:hypothetical protein PoB_001290700 [Plakobranchus ocellatus]|uniref:Uncharacterized protein n=1 Tax=Plakobranchus ocellatus TaxID=259542 RepID=A0AAV3YTX8_9GAST|nr:hypothetical protein PoB_001290700 [Plakobranchus ocellatus]
MVHIAQSLVKCFTKYFPIGFAEIPSGVVVPSVRQCTTVDGYERRQMMGADVSKNFPCMDFARSVETTPLMRRYYRNRRPDDERLHHLPLADA